MSEANARLRLQQSKHWQHESWDFEGPSATRFFVVVQHPTAFSWLTDCQQPWQVIGVFTPIATACA
ncbi:MAG TPA: hypothetical protein VGD78_04525 [Chthoniobacterales bacterium]